MGIQIVHPGSPSVGAGGIIVARPLPSGNDAAAAAAMSLWRAEAIDGNQWHWSE